MSLVDGSRVEDRDRGAPDGAVGVAAGIGVGVSHR